MKALKIHGAGHMTTEQVPVPEPGVGEVRVRMQYGGICGSDLHYFFEGRNGEFEVLEPFTPGHEMSGVVDLDPSGRLAAGTPVAIAPATYGTPEAGIEDRRHLWPGGTYFGSASTRPHTQGGMQEYRVVQDFMIRPLPEGLATKPPRWPNRSRWPCTRSGWPAAWPTGRCSSPAAARSACAWLPPAWRRAPHVSTPRTPSRGRWTGRARSARQPPTAPGWTTSRRRPTTPSSSAPAPPRPSARRSGPCDARGRWRRSGCSPTSRSA